MKRVPITFILVAVAILPSPASAEPQWGTETVEYGSALSHSLRRADGVIADTTTIIGMKKDGTGWIRMRMCTAAACTEIFDTLSRSEYWIGGLEPIEFYLQADVEGLGWVDVAIGNLNAQGGTDQSLNPTTKTVVVGKALPLDGWTAEATDHSSSTWGDWRSWGSRVSFNAYNAELTWIWAE